ncbi:hypothetical protein L484_011789 [Morus notabilis]|uniref:Prolamin-like domain-containing protein n=1 Tax=Morus notabilis TaxID=981085 RepID=W9SBU9_9ROSA|nr:hypothetical protein L484_011789 [Morus notabilis]
MKKHSVFLVLFFTLNASTIFIPTVESREGCPGPFFPPTPCTGDVLFNMIVQKRPISSSCCAAISDISNNCPSPFRPWWFFKAEKNCIENEVTPPAPTNDAGNIATPPPPDQPKSSESPPPPDQPKSSEYPPPPYRNNETCPDISRLYVPCHEQIEAYYEHNVPISPSCCALIIEVHDKCSPRDWSDLAIKCHDYCLNHH